MNYQEKRIECKHLNTISFNRGEVTELNKLDSNTESLIESYYTHKREFIRAYYDYLEQKALKDSNKRIDKIKFSEALYHESFGKYIALGSILRALETCLNIKPDRGVDYYNISKGDK